jgi:annexin A7/11
VFQTYHNTHGVAFEKVIEGEFSGAVESGMLAIVKCMTDCSVYFAERLHSSMSGAGTDDKALIRIVVSRAECDLADIKAAFQQKYGKSLESFIEVQENFSIFFVEFSFNFLFLPFLTYIQIPSITFRMMCLR